MCHPSVSGMAENGVETGWCGGVGKPVRFQNTCTASRAYASHARRLCFTAHHSIPSHSPILHPMCTAPALTFEIPPPRPKRKPSEAAAGGKAPAASAAQGGSVATGGCGGSSKGKDPSKQSSGQSTLLSLPSLGTAVVAALGLQPHQQQPRSQTPPLLQPAGAGQHESAGAGDQAAAAAAEEQGLLAQVCTLCPCTFV